jgi:hypothetical protein
MLPVSRSPSLRRTGQVVGGMSARCCFCRALSRPMQRFVLASCRTHRDTRCVLVPSFCRGSPSGRLLTWPMRARSVTARRTDHLMRPPAKRLGAQCFAPLYQDGILPHRYLVGCACSVDVVLHELLPCIAHYRAVPAPGLCGRPSPRARVVKRPTRRATQPQCAAVNRV